MRKGHGTVYIVGNPKVKIEDRDGGLYRIGWTDNHLDIRVAQIRHDTPAFSVMEVASSWVKDAPQVEAQLKNLFKPNRVPGGWFFLQIKDLALARRILGLDLF